MTSNQSKKLKVNQKVIWTMPGRDHWKGFVKSIVIGDHFVIEWEDGLQTDHFYGRFDQTLKYIDLLVE